MGNKLVAFRGHVLRWAWVQNILFINQLVNIFSTAAESGYHEWNSLIKNKQEQLRYDLSVLDCFEPLLLSDVLASNEKGAQLLSYQYSKHRFPEDETNTPNKLYEHKNTVAFMRHRVIYRGCIARICIREKHWFVDDEEQNVLFRYVRKTTDRSVGIETEAEASRYYKSSSSEDSSEEELSSASSIAMVVMAFMTGWGMRLRMMGWAGRLKPFFPICMRE